MTQFKELLAALSAARVNYIVIGGVAAIAHGATRLTFDLDILYSRDRENLERLAAALEPFSPYLRGAPPGLPFRWDARTIERGMNFTLTTNAGSVDVLGEVPGGTFDELLPLAEARDLEGQAINIVDLPSLIILKRAAGRPKDFEAIAELELLQSRRDEPPPRN